MRNDISMRELKREIEKLKIKTTKKTGFFIILSIIGISIAIMIFVLQLKNKRANKHFQDDDFNEEDFEDYYAYDYYYEED